jgi:hypothetical protein
METRRNAKMKSPQLDKPCRNSGGGTLIKFADQANANFAAG